MTDELKQEHHVLEFDNYPNKIGTVEVIENDNNQDEMWISDGNHRKLLLDAYRDQWGVFLSIGGITIAQEDGTRSFIDAMIKGLLRIRDRNEYKTTDCTETL